MDGVKIKFVGSGKHNMPTLGTQGSAAYDLYVPKDTIVPTGRSVIKLGFCMELPQGFAAEIHPRSGYAAEGMEGYELRRTEMFDALSRKIQSMGKYVSIEPARFNADVVYGLVDSDYRDEVGVIINNSDGEFLVKEGTRIAQMLIIPVVQMPFKEATELSETDRKGGFGSTNNN